MVLGAADSEHACSSSTCFVDLATGAVTSFAPAEAFSGFDPSSRYFVLDDTPMGSMAEQTVIDVDRSIVLPRDTDPVAVAASTPATGPTTLAAGGRESVTSGGRRRQPL